MLFDPASCSGVEAEWSATCDPKQAKAADLDEASKWPRQNQFDAAFLSDSGEGAWGFVARSDTGGFIAAAAGKLHNLKDTLRAEAEACVPAVESAVDLGLHRVVFESDSQVLVSAIKKKL